MAEVIISHELYGSLNLNEFLQFLKQFKRGDYGKIYQSARPNPQEFLICLQEYWNELVQHRIRLSQKQEQERRKKQEKIDKENAMTYDEWKEIKTIIAMYNSEYSV